MAKITIDIRELNLAPLQRERFQFLLGPRYNPKKPHFCKIVISQYNTFQENYIRANETLRELFWEAKRAPTDNTTVKRNPYRRESLMKKFMGRTREERLAKMAEFKKLQKERLDAIEHERYVAGPKREAEEARARSIKH